jgi:hypothetical protein
MGEMSNNSPDLLPDLREAINESKMICRHFQAWQTFMLLNASRAESFREHDLMIPAGQYVNESAVILPYLLENGALRVCTREVRFLVDVGLKLCLTNQASDQARVDTSLSGRVAFVREHVDRTSFSREIMKVRPDLLSHDGDEFLQFAKKLYDDASGYVHLSAHSLDQATRISLGKESVADVLDQRRLLERGLTVSLVLLCHSVPEWVVGDYCVESDGSTVRSHFMRSRYLARIDEHFDYKHERQHNLEGIKQARQSGVRPCDE